MYAHMRAQHSRIPFRVRTKRAHAKKPPPQACTRAIAKRACEIHYVCIYTVVGGVGFVHAHLHIHIVHASRREKHVWRACYSTNTSHTRARKIKPKSTFPINTSRQRRARLHRQRSLTLFQGLVRIHASKNTMLHCMQA